MSRDGGLSFKMFFISVIFFPFSPTKHTYITYSVRDIDMSCLYLLSLRLASNKVHYRKKPLFFCSFNYKAVSNLHIGNTNCISKLLANPRECQFCAVDGMAVVVVVVVTFATEVSSGMLIWNCSSTTKYVTIVANS